MTNQARGPRWAYSLELAIALLVLVLVIAVATCAAGCGATSGAATALAIAQTTRGVTCFACRKLLESGLCPEPIVELGRPDGGPP